MPQSELPTQPESRGARPFCSVLTLMPILHPAPIASQRTAKDSLHYVWQIRQLFRNGVAYDTVIRFGNGGGCTLISNKHSCVLLTCQRSWHTQPLFAVQGPVSEGCEFKDIMIFWSVEVRGDFVLSVNGIVWQRQLANEPLPHQRLCSLGVSSSSLTTNRNVRWYLRFPKQEAVKSSRRAIHFPLTMMLLLPLLGGYWSVSQRVARKVAHPHFSPDGKPSLQWSQERSGFCAELVKLLWLGFCSYLPSASLQWPPHCSHSMVRSSFNPPFQVSSMELREVSTHELMQYIWLL